MKKRKLKNEAKIVIFIMLGIIIIATAIIIIAHIERFDYDRCLNDIVLSIDNTDISLQELSYYIMMVEKTGDEMAKVYDPDKPLAYWNLYMNDVKESGYVSELARNAAVNFCIRDNIYYKEAAKEGMELSEDEISDLKYDAESKYNLLTNKQRTVTKLDAADLNLIMTKEFVSKKYMAKLAEEDESDTLEAALFKYDVDGSYYESLKEKYTIVTDKKMLNNIKVGFITIN